MSGKLSHAQCQVTRAGNTSRFQVLIKIKATEVVVKTDSYIPDSSNEK